MRGITHRGTKGTTRRLRTPVSAAAVAVLAVTAVPPGAAAAGPAGVRAAGVERLSVATDGTQGDGHSVDASITPDGRRVVFTSSAGNLIPGGTTATRKVYLRDRQAGQTTRLGHEEPLKPAAISGDGGFAGYPVQWMRNEHIRLHRVSTGESIGHSCTAYNCEMSLGADGLRLAYSVRFRPPEPNQRIEVVDWVSNHTYTVDVLHNTHPSRPSLSDDAHHLAYQDGGEQDVFVWNRTTGTPVGPIEGPARAATLVQLSDDGSTVVYLSGADTYVHDTASGTARTVPDVRGVAIDPTGRFLLYAPSGTSGPSPLTLRDLRTGTDATVSAQPATAGIDAVSAGGREVVFQSAAEDIVPGDTNGRTDVFLRSLP
ncbi:WD40 repeat domain-containing protein [Streptomyces sp. NPDC001985]|uniref:WD40 repeat domain-containing protein n=1 Tax=Streptomyces sp. NPDC001985 TaxID=3154406 RepID=UPI00331D9326